MDILIDRLVGFMTVLTRISAFFLVAPVFSWQSIPRSIKITAPIMLAIFFSITNPPVIGAEQMPALQAIILLSMEATYGLALGAIANVIFYTVKLSGIIAEHQIGLSMAEILDPLTEDRGAPIANLLEMLFIITFLAAHGHHLLIKVIQQSYELFPTGKIPSTAILASRMLEASTMMFSAGLRLAAPILASMLVLLVALAILARIVPEMNIFFISFPIRIIVGLGLLVVCAPFIPEFVTEAARLMEKMLPL